jgi:catechol 2,3-dioxygenase-like lactoylglutathione lyase family enzyme
MIRGIHHTAIATKDLDRLLSFYRDLLGLEVVYSATIERGTKEIDDLFDLPDSACRLAMLKAGNGFIELFEFSNPPGGPGNPTRPVCDPGFTHICLNVHDIHHEYDRLRAAGMRFHCPPFHTPGFCWATYGRDPDGNVIELLEPAAGAPIELPRLAG